MAEFVTTSHTHISISSYFFLVKKYFEKYMKRNASFIFAPVMVTDFSWTLISSIIEAFNSMTVIQYLKYCFEILVHKKDSSTLKTIIYLCAAHFIKLVVKKVKKTEPHLNHEVKKCFVYCFSLLQNSTSLIEFEDSFINIVKMFNSPTINTTSSNSINILRNRIRNRDPSDLAYINYEGSQSKEDLDREANTELLFMFDKNQIQTVVTLKKASKLQSYFENILESNLEIINKYDISKNRNPFYSPNLVKIIMNYIYLLPLWSGVMLNLKTGCFLQYKNKKRTTNNPVENHFEFDKNKLLFGKLKVKPSEYVAPKYRFLLSKFISNYLNNFSKQKKIKKQILDEIEKWKIQKEQNRVASFYYQNIAIFDKNVEYKSMVSFSTLMAQEDMINNCKEAKDNNENFASLLLSK